jgi:hypothetical protein
MTEISLVDTHWRQGLGRGRRMYIPRQAMPCCDKSDACQQETDLIDRRTTD